MATPPTSPIRILHILHGLTMGGMENRVARLAAGLDPARYAITVLTFRKTPGPAVAFAPHVRMEFLEIPPGLHAGALLGLRRFIRAGAFDIVHTHNWGSMFYGVLAARLARTRVIFQGEHGLEGEGGIPWKRLAAQRVLARLLTRVVAVNKPIAKHVERAWRLPESRVLCIPNGVDLMRFRPVAASPEAGPIVFGSIMRFGAVKNIPCMIEGFRLLVARRGRAAARLSLVGTGPEMDATVLAIQGAGLQDLVALPGDARRPEDHYAIFSAYLNASVYEGMSNTILEAMACGLPIIASDVPGNRDLIGDQPGAVLFKSGDPAALCDRMDALLQDPELRAKMGTASREAAEREFDNADFLKAYRAAYADCLR